MDKHLVTELFMPCETLSPSQNPPGFHKNGFNIFVWLYGETTDFSFLFSLDSLVLPQNVRSAFWGSIQHNSLLINYSYWVIQVRKFLLREQRKSSHWPTSTVKNPWFVCSHNINKGLSSFSGTLVYEDKAYLLMTSLDTISLEELRNIYVNEVT